MIFQEAYKVLMSDLATAHLELSSDTKAVLPSHIVEWDFKPQENLEWQ